MREYQLYIDGQFVDAADAKTLESINPFDQSVIARVSLAGVEATEKAIIAISAVSRK